jgi:DNA mismatch repair protein MutS
MECGSFYELYDDGSKQTDLRSVGELLGIQVSRRNKSIVEVSRSNLEMAGFPSYALNKFLAILTRHNYTVVVVSQTTPPPNPKREVTHVVSPGTYIEDDNHDNQLTNYLMCVYFERHNDFKTKRPLLVVGTSFIDLGTGKTYAMETISRINDIQYALDELYRLCVTYNPREVIICGDPQSLVDVVSYNQLIKHLDLEDKCHHNGFIGFDKSITKPTYQEEILKRVFDGSRTGLLSCVEYVGLENMPCALASYIRLLQFVNNHNEKVLVKVGPPEIIQETNTLVLSYNSIKQLDIISSNTVSRSQSLYDILNNCKTTVGKRYFKERLMSPLRNHVQLNECYKNIQQLLDNQSFQGIRNALTNVYDVERLFRKVDMGTIHPCELWNLHMSCQCILNALGMNTMIQTYIPSITTCLDEILLLMNTMLNIEELPKYNQDNISASIFQGGHHKDLDALFETYNDIKNVFGEVASALNAIHNHNVENNNNTIFKVENNERDGYYLLITSKRLSEFVKAHKQECVYIRGKPIRVADLTSKSVSHSSANAKVTHSLISNYNDQLDITNAKLKRLVLDVYKTYVKDLSDTTSQYANKICKALAEMDFLACCAYNAFIFRHTTPIIMDKYEGKSFIHAKGLRHPIIEQIAQDVKYVTNDVTLGVPTEQDGMLLYGLNSSGKSSLMKSIGLAIVMAQSGMFVPCEYMEYCPYDYIFTRILSCDDIFKGQSTFTKEMLELRGILKRSNKNSLVLGDELCSGTESISALSIVSAGLITLARRQSSFVFATHLHDLIKIPEVNALDNVKVYHLSVEYDMNKKQLVYDRKLKEGNGSTLYGLEVCKSLDLDNDFLHLANSVRHKLLETEANILSSSSNNNKYNKKLYVDRCQLCGGHAKEVHHISQQKDADEHGYIGDFHKNNKFNLVGLCEKCHDKVHCGEMVIEGYKQTTEGVVLDVSDGTSDQEEESEEEDVPLDLDKDIQQLLKHMPRLKKVDIIKSLQTRHQGVSKYRLAKKIKEIEQIMSSTS